MREFSWDEYMCMSGMLDTLCLLNLAFSYAVNTKDPTVMTIYGDYINNPNATYRIEVREYE